jgi:hypothetical protein
MDLDDAVMLTDVTPTVTRLQKWAVSGRVIQWWCLVPGRWHYGRPLCLVIWSRAGDRYDHIDYRLEFAKSYAYCEAYNFKDMDDPVVFLKRTTGWLGADVCIDAVGGDAAGDAFQTLTGRRLLLTGGAATALHWAINQ